MRIGTGWDIHPLVEGRDLVLGGVYIENDRGCLGHSDGDALIHAVIDAMLGAAGLGDIGDMFPDTDETFRGISSVVLLRLANDKLRENDFDIVNVDCTVILQSPKLGHYKDRMREAIAEALDLDVDKVNVKAKTAEHMMGELGSSDAVMAQAAVLIEET